MSRAIKWTYNFEHDSVERLQNIEIPIDVVALRTAHIHGIASWFDVAFCGSERKVWLSTSPSEPLTHWYQVRCLLHRPLLVQKGQQVLGRLLMVANDKFVYIYLFV
jgi:histone-arginine methyltransferase CARM1